ncbi:MAG: hypothetical protein A2Z27_02085 [candidate division Zixibacteria bacterium RBG_16_50_21]|nr:MAG: hypothetical protein A2Z27_02085 [candidate division Zixibacteria bacterium RBG_16_50_21]
MQGWIKLPRELVLEPIFDTDQPYCQIAAYLDLLLLASHLPHQLKFGSRCLQVAEGEIITSLERLARRWNWTKNRVKRYLLVLQGMRLVDFQTQRFLTRVRLCKWPAYQRGQVVDLTAVVPLPVPQSAPKTQRARTEHVTAAPTINNDKKDVNDENEKKNSESQNLNFVRAKKSYEELTEAEKELAQECARFYEQTFNSEIDFNKLAILVYGSEEDKQVCGFGDWQTLRKALGCLSREQLTYKVLHLYYYIWGLSREKEYVEKMKKLVEETSICPSPPLP